MNYGRRWYKRGAGGGEEKGRRGGGRTIGLPSASEGKGGSFLDSEILRHNEAYMATNLGAVTARAKIRVMMPSRISTEEIPTSISCSLKFSKLSKVILLRILHRG